MRSVAVLLVAAALVPSLAGCGGTAAPSRAEAEAQQEWYANIAVVIDQLRNDVAQTQVVGATARAAREALADESALYGLLVAYSDLAGCRHIVASAGAGPSGAERIEEPLARACRHLERAADLFMEATTHDAGRPLAAATREARRALPALVRAAGALAQATGRGTVRR